MSLREKQEPEVYSVEAMMNRLKSGGGGGEEGEEQIVTRDDGTRLRKVRRRKRRSEQLVYEQRERSQKMRIVKIALGLGALCLIPICVGGWFVYLNTNSFREKLTQRVAEQVQGKVQIVGAKVTPMRVSAHQIRADWGNHSFLKSLLIEDIRGDLRSDTVFRKKWVGDKLLANRGVLNVDLPIEGASVAGDPPQYMSFSEVVSQNCKLSLGDARHPVAVIENTEISYSRQLEDQQFRVSLNGGNLSLSDFPCRFSIDRSTLNWNDLQCEAMIRLQKPKDFQGLLMLTGKFAINEEKSARLHADLKSYAFDGLVSVGMGRLLYGRVNSDDSAAVENQLVFNPYKRSEGFFSVNLKGDLVEFPLTLRGFSFLTQLASLFGDRWFLNPSFTQDSKFQLILNDKGTELKRVALEARNRLRIEGQLQERLDGSLEGTFEVGLPVRMFVDVEKSLKMVFEQERDGFRWVKIQISGNVASPQDDLEKLVKQAKGKDERRESLPIEPVSPSSGGGSEFDQLINGQ